MQNTEKFHGTCFLRIKLGRIKWYFYSISSFLNMLIATHGPLQFK